MRLLVWHRHLFLAVTTSLLLMPKLCNAKFNEEVVERVSEHLDRFMSRPREILDFQLAFRSIGGFAHDMGPADRDTFFAMAFALFGQPNTFYALEDGTFTGVASGGAYAFSRENGDTLYQVPEGPEDPNWKYWTSCVNAKTGQQENCSASNPALVGTDGRYKYHVECVDDCALAPCPDPDSQRNCSAVANETLAEECLDNIKYCPQYTIGEKNFSALAEQNITYGFIPRWYHCIDEKGRVTEGDECIFQDNETPVERNMTGNYSYCEGKGGPCNPIKGNYRVAYYDARYRPFYTIIRDAQKPLWSPLEESFNSFEISYSAPIYSTDDQGRNVFDGVMAMDYDLKDITEFLTRAYSHTDIAVALFENEDPHYVIASSTGSNPSFAALISDPTVPCPYEETTVEGKRQCDPVRIPMANLSGHSGKESDRILAQAFVHLQNAGFPRRELVTFNLNDDLSQDFYVATVAQYQTPEAGLNWTFVVAMPGQSSADSLTSSQPGFTLICGVAAFGATICFLFLLTFMVNRKKKAIMMADWRFTCLFFSGCISLNLVSFTFLGNNSDATCLLRMWCFHMAFVATISPLLAKCFRMRLLVSERGTVTRRRTVTHLQTFMFMLPPIVLQACILFIFTFADPPTATETLENPATVDVSQHVICSHNTQAFFIVQIIVEGSLMLAGAVLAYHLRHIESKFGESKQLVFAMSSMLGVGAITLILSSMLEYDDTGKKVIYAVGICWGTVVSCCAFALPRLLLTVKNDQMRKSTIGRSGSNLRSGHHFRDSMHMTAPSSPFATTNNSATVPIPPGVLTATLETEQTSESDRSGDKPDSGDKQV